jgi:hypothetical protein
LLFSATLGFSTPSTTTHEHSLSRLQTLANAHQQNFTPALLHKSNTRNLLGHRLISFRGLITREKKRHFCDNTRSSNRKGSKDRKGRHARCHPHHNSSILAAVEPIPYPGPRKQLLHTPSHISAPPGRVPPPNPPLPRAAARALRRLPVVQCDREMLPRSASDGGAISKRCPLR